MVMNAVLTVDPSIVSAKLNSFQAKRVTLGSIMEAIKNAMTTLTTVSWLGPASRKLMDMFSKLYEQIEEAIRIVEEYIEDLQIAIELYNKNENAQQEKANALPTDIFGI